MKRHITSALLLAGVAVAASTSPAVAAVPRLDVAGIAKYVYPDNRRCNLTETPAYMPDGETYLLVSDDGKKIVSFNTADGKEAGTVLDAATTRENKLPGDIEGFTISPDGSKLLVWTDSEPVYRRSSKARYYIFEIKRNILRPLSKSSGKQQAPLFSPDSRMVAFVTDNNIRIRKWDYDTEVDVTADGKHGKIINGIPDWTYEEEFSAVCSMAWSPDNTTLCYLRYDEEEVPWYSLPIYKGYCDADDRYALYPGTFTYKYPVAGEKNSTVTLHSYDVDNRKIKDIKLPDSRIEYIPRIGFGGTDSERLIVTTLNRDQNRMEVYSVNPRSTVAKSIIVEETADGWLNPMTYEDMSLQDDGIVLFSERSGWNHLYHYTYAGQMTRRITSGDFDVTDYFGTDPAGMVYYQAEPSTGKPSDALNRAIYRLNPKNGKTEPLTPETGWASAEFTPAKNYFTLNYSTATTPPVYTLRNGKNKVVRTLADNAAYAADYAGAPQKEFLTINSDGTELNAYMVKPAGFDPSRRYPVIMWQYSGPGSQEVFNRWAMDWDIYAAQQGFLVVCVDGRGTGGRGTAFRNIVYRRLGHYETIDQLNAARWVASLPYVNPDAIGIAGWSYGGYETLMCATEANGPYAAAVAVAPVTSWRFYDTVYSERFMLTPQQNGPAYDSGAPLERASSLACPLLLMYGTADDNVHPENTIEFVSLLQEAGMDCDVLMFPNMNHSINGCDSRRVVYAKMIDFFRRNLK